MKVEQLMSRGVHSCFIDDSLEDAARIMWERDCGCVPVVDAGGRAVGIVTDRDICMAAYLRGRPLRELPVTESMATQIVACRADQSLADCEGVMRNAQLRRLLVTDRSGRLVGLISLNDIAREAAREQRERSPEVTLSEVALTLGAVGRPRFAAAGAA